MIFLYINETKQMNEKEKGPETVNSLEKPCSQPKGILFDIDIFWV